MPCFLEFIHDDEVDLPHYCIAENMYWSSYTIHMISWYLIAAWENREYNLFYNRAQVSIPPVITGLMTETWIDARQPIRNVSINIVQVSHISMTMNLFEKLASAAAIQNQVISGRSTVISILLYCRMERSMASLYFASISTRVLCLWLGIIKWYLILELWSGPWWLIVVSTVL